MNDFVDIGQLSTRIRSAEVEHAQALAGQVRRLADRRLARALEGAGDRALARAQLPPGAVVAVQRLDLHLKVAVDVAEDELASGWAAAFEAGLARLLGSTAAGDIDDDATAVWFADAWDAERRHLERCIQGAPEAWWAAELAGDGDGAAPLSAPAILQVWLQRDPSRAVNTLAELVRGDARAVTLLSAAEAEAFTRALLRRLALPDAAFASAPADTPATPTEATTALPDAPHRARPDEGLPPTLVAALAYIGAGHRQRLLAAAHDAAQTLPWLAALLLSASPSLSGLPADRLAQGLAQLSMGAGIEATGRDPAPASGHQPSRGATPAAVAPSDSQIVPVAPTPVHAGGLLMLLRPLIRLGLLPAPDRLGSALGDLALCALRRVLAPLSPGEGAVAQERERPLLAVFAPERDWRERIALIPILDPADAEARLDALVTAIPAGVTAAPGSLRQIFGTQPAAFATEHETRLAHLLLRPGLLRHTPWEAELIWPLAAVDLALRRAGWDQDPGWLPWLGRTLRFRFGDPS